MGNFNAPSAKGKGPASASDLSETAKAPSTPQGVRVPDRESAKPSVTPTATVAVPTKSRTANAGAVGPSSASGSRPTSQGHERPVAQTSPVLPEIIHQASAATGPSAAVSQERNPESHEEPHAQPHGSEMSFELYESIVINILEGVTVLCGGFPRMAAAFETLDQPRNRLESLQVENARLSGQCATVSATVTGRITK
ncbi:hypothetical protein HDU98_000133 [Podochytrium sp. JEL0797]|nr:hypothetical protein HDU98_000133 [Podochytrium sp. JEL0797]